MSMTTAADLVAATERHLLSGDRDTLNKLRTGVTADETSVVLTYDIASLSTGDYLAIDLEVLYVWDVNRSSMTVTVERGMLGSTAAAHDQDALVYVNPTNAKHDIFEALNQELADLSTPESGLFAVVSTDLTVHPVEMTYALPAGTIHKILDVRYDESSSANSWPRVDPRDRFLMQDANTDDFASGNALRIDVTMETGRTLRVTYATAFTAMSSLASTLSSTGLAASMYDIPALGAAARLMGVREAKRGLAERTDTGRMDVPPGGAARSAAVLMELRNARVRAEAGALRRAWPYS